MDLVNKFLALQQSLTRLGFQDGQLEQDVNAKTQKIIKSCCERLNVSRVSIWLFSDDQKSIVCSNLYILAEKKFETGIVIHEETCPHYFASLRQNRVINADNARTDDRTKEFLDGYLKPLNIMSMLDVPIFNEKGMFGLICIEQAEKQRNWDMAEISYSVSVADTISLVYAQSNWFIEKQKLSYLEKIDPLTNLENRLFFQKRINQTIDTAIKNIPCAVLLVGMDNFTQINDRFGYHFANQVLREISLRLDNIDLDLKYQLARVEGDVFAFWLPQVINDKLIDELVSKIKLQFVEEIKTPLDETIATSASIGVFLGPIKDLVDNDPIRKAELAMQKAKNEQQGSDCYFDPEWLTNHLEAVTLEREFIEALNKNQIIAFYQPIVKPDYPTVGISLEALVRWEHPEKGIITPYLILPIAKRLGLMKELGDIILEQACRDIRYFLDSGIVINKVSVNISSEQLFSPNLVAQIKRYVAQYQIAFSALEFEIVEELIAGDSEALSHQLEQLSNLGINLSIDDFGTGYSSLSRLKNLKVSKLKIDKSFVDGLPNNESDICIAQSIIGLAKGMKLEIVAEGVESKIQAHWLLANGCDFIQGYLVSKPIKAEQITDFLKNENALDKL
ncbi:sensor domain-containing phosphodiesterase [Algibacillus agarilyticus]|uniref:sensor domain-containing phosphodiesterase n=1 Tax=Algibacillus agarilyticus TaxID=2234133 RepID=UPI000DCFB1DA|nr:sensor domain-containing phosphodiesterase [Algibacillus agarilyticus]